MLGNKFWKNKIEKKTIFLAAIRRLQNQDTGSKLVESIQKI